MSIVVDNVSSGYATGMDRTRRHTIRDVAEEAEVSVARALG